MVSASCSCKIKNEWGCKFPVIWHPDIDTNSFTFFFRLFVAKDIWKQLMEQILGIPMPVVINSPVYLCINSIKLNLHIFNCSL